MIIEGALAHAPVTASTTRTRQTPATGTERFRDVLRAGGEVLAAGAAAAVSALPGGPVLAAAVRGTADAVSRVASEAAAGGGAASPGGAAGGAGAEGESDIWALTRQSQEFNLMYLQLQEEMSRESRRFTTLSNVLKTRHETCRGIIQNV